MSESLRTTRWARPLIAVLITLVATVGFFIRREDRPPALDAAAVTRFFASRVTSPDGQAQALSQWRGKRLVVNYWATWCAPCREEMPALSRLSRQFADRDVQFIGIAIDSADNVRRYAAATPSAYPLLIGDADALELSKALGNALLGLPFTLIIDPGGVLRHRQLGAIDAAHLAVWLQQLAATPAILNSDR